MEDSFLTVFRGRKLEIAVVCLFFLFFSYDGCRDWDENTYLARAAYLPISRMEAWISLVPGRAVWEPDWYNAKVAHMAILQGLFHLFGTGQKALFSVSLFYALLVIGAIGLNYLILRSVFHNRAFSYEASLLMLASPLAFFLSYKALTETTALFFITLSIYLFVRSWNKTTGRRIILYLASSISFIVATASRMEVAVLFYSFAPALLALNPSDVRKIFNRYAGITVFFAGGLFIYFFITGLNPYAAINNQVLSKSQRIVSGNILNTILSVGLLAPFICLSVTTIKSPRFRFGAILYALPTAVIFAALIIVALRHQFMALSGSAILAYLGLRRIGEWFSLRLRKRTVQALLTLFLIGIFGGNLFLIETLGEVGLKGDDINVVIRKLARSHPRSLILVDSPTNTYAYLTVAFPEFDLGLTQPGTAFDPEPVDSLERLKRVLKERPVVYLWAYNKDRNWLELLIDKIKGKKPFLKTIRKTGLFWSEPSIALSPIISRGQYVAYEVEIRSAGNK